MHDVATKPPAIDDARLAGIIDFLQAAEKLKDTIRSGRTSGGRPESTAEHSWRLCLMIMTFDRELAGCDLLKLLKLCILHDLGEAVSGDIPATDQRPDDNKAERERADMLTLCTPLPADICEEFMALWDEYDAAKTPEAVFAKGFDKLETMLQHNIGRNRPDFDYAFNLSYGIEQTRRHPLLAQIRELVEMGTRARMETAGQ